MQIILLERVVNLGQLGDVVRVKDGYARNFLIPQGKARRATDAALKEFEARRAELEKVQSDKLAVARTLGERLAKTAGFKPQEFMFDQTPGRGGAASNLPTYDLSLGDLTQQIKVLNWLQAQNPCLIKKHQTLKPV